MFLQRPVHKYYSSFIQNHPNLEPVHMFSNGGMDKENLWHFHSTQSTVIERTTSLNHKCSTLSDRSRPKGPAVGALNMTSGQGKTTEAGNRW
jgi:hypothetical protein